MVGKDPDTDALLQRAQAGDREARSDLFNRYRNRFQKMVTIRLDPRVCRRVDPSDVVQEAMVQASQRFPAYL